MTKMHITENTFEKYILAPDELTQDEMKNIEVHLDDCVLCKENYTKLHEFHTAMEENLRTEPTERDKVFAQKLLSWRKQVIPFRKPELAQHSKDEIDTYFEIIEPYRRPLAQRITRYIQIHPIRSVVRLSMAACLAALALFVVKPFKDENPVFAEVKNYVLYAYNKDGDNLWTKGAVGMKNRQSTMDDPDQEYSGCLRIGDIDDDGKNEVLISGVNTNGLFTQDSLYCYESDGKLRWGINIGTIISFGNKSNLQHSNRRIFDFRILKKNNISKPQIFVLCNEVEFSPTKISEIDPIDGRERQAFYNRGGGGFLLDKDIDKDGTVDLLALGINDAFNRAYLAVLDPSDINGYAPVTPNYTPQGVLPAKLKYYLLFPITILENKYSGTPYNIPYGISESDDRSVSIKITNYLNHFPIKDLNVQLVYSLDSLLKVKSVVGGDGFIKANNYMLENGMLKESLIPNYINSLKDSVLYWDGEKFVNTPTMNKKYQISNNPI